MTETTLWYERPKQPRSRFRWWFFAGAVLATTLPFLPYITYYSPLRVTLDNIADMRFDFWPPLQDIKALGVTFFTAIPLLLWRTRIITLGKPCAIEIIAGYGFALISAVPITCLLTAWWTSCLLELWASGTIPPLDRPLVAAMATATATLFIGVWAAWRLLRKRQHALVIQCCVLSAYAANLLLCTIIFRPFGDDFLSGRSSVGYYLGLPVLLLALLELFTRAFIKDNRQ